jgi:predicted porin
MKKTLVALAALAATSAFAQSSVSISGNFDIGWKAQTHTGATGQGATATGISDGAMAPNRITFDGTEDLGGGLKAIFKSEIGINPTNDELTGNRTGNSGIQYDQALNNAAAAAPNLHTGGTGYSQNTNRQTWVELNDAKLGALRVGYLVTHLYQASSQSGYNQTFEGLVGADVIHTHGAAFVGGTRGNGIQYTLPAMGALKLSAQYGTGNGRQTLETSNATTRDNLSRFSFKLDYSDSGFNGTYAYTSAKTVTTASILNANAQGEALTAPANADNNASLHQFLGSYNFGAFSVAALYNTGESKANLATATTPVGGATSYRSTQLTAWMPIGNWTLRGSLGNLVTEAPTNPGTTTVDLKGNQFGTTYNFSKRTVGYFMTGRTEDSGTARSAWNARRSAYVIGVNHAF